MNRDAAEDYALGLRLLRLSEADRWDIVRSLSWAQAREWLGRWSFWAHHGQATPEGDWRVWLIRAGRGFGKTRAGAEWVSALARADPKAVIALVGASRNEVRQVMIEGAAGLRAVARPGERLAYYHTTGQLHFPSGAVAHVYSANAPEGLRGPEHHAAWCDELAKWRYPAAWDNLMMGLRGGEDPRVLVTTTPRRSAVLAKVLAATGLVVTTGSSHHNPHLPTAYLDGLVADYGGTRLARQEIDGELIDDVEGTLWTRAMLDGCRVKRQSKRLGGLARVVVGVDPPATAGGDACGIVAAGLGRDGKAYVLEDASVAGLSPEGWARAVAKCARRWRAERVVAERNMGGDMVASVLAGADRTLPVKLVVASRGKVARAEPVAAAYERGEVRHVGAFPELEDELAGLQAGGGYQGPGRSPDRADACVWALTELLLRRRGAVRVRGLA